MVVICRAAAGETVMPSEEAPAATTDRALAPIAVVVHPAWDLEVEAVVGVVEVEAGVDAGEAAELPEANLRGAQNEINLCE